MTTFLYFLSYNSLVSLLNLILVGLVVFFAMNRFRYMINVALYAVAKTFIPIITALLIGCLIGTNVSFSLSGILILLITYFLLGLPVIKITEKIIRYFSFDTILHFLAVFAITESIISWLFSLVLKLILWVIIFYSPKSSILSIPNGSSVYHSESVWIM